MNSYELFENNKKLVFYVIKKLRHNYQKDHAIVELDDMVQVGYIGLWKAAQRFDESKDFKFATYAVPTIMGEILKEIRDKSGLFKVPRESKLIFKKIAKKRDNGEGIPTPEEVQEEFSCSLDTARVAIELLFLSVSSLSTPVTVGERKDVYIEDMIEDVSANFQDGVFKEEAFKERMSLLNDREKFIIFQTLNGVKQMDISKKMGISQVQVSRIFRKALKKIEEYNEVIANENEPQFA